MWARGKMAGRSIFWFFALEKLRLFFEISRRTCTPPCWCKDFFHHCTSCASKGVILSARSYSRQARSCIPCVILWTADVFETECGCLRTFSRMCSARAIASALLTTLLLQLVFAGGIFAPRLVDARRRAVLCAADCVQHQT